MMKLFSFRFIALMAVVVGLLTMTGCEEKDNPRRPTGSLVKIKLNVNTGLDSPSSRANDDPNDFEGAVGDFENISTLRVIIVNKFQSYIVDGVTTQTGTVEVNKLVSTAPDGTPLVDKLEFVVENNETKRIYLIANEDALTPPNSSYSTARAFLDDVNEGELAPIARLDGWIYQAPHDGVYFKGEMFSNGNQNVLFPGMPLTERFTVPVAGKPITVSTNDGDGLPSFLDNEAVQVYLFLTRAAAKATFNFSVSGEYKGTGLEMRAVQIENLNYSEYVFPHSAEYQPAKYIFDANGDTLINYIPDAERWITSFSSPETTYAIYRVNLKEPLKLEAGKRISNLGPFYFPESMGDANMKDITVSVLLVDPNDPNDQGSWLTSQPLNNILSITDRNETVQAIARNTHLKIDVDFGDPDIKWNAIVAPYNTRELNPGFGFEQVAGDPTNPDYTE